MADPAPTERPERLMRPAEAAAVFGVDTRALRGWDALRRLTVKRTLGGHRRYLPSEVYALAASLTVEADVAVTV